MNEYIPPFVIHKRLLISEVSDYLEIRIEELKDLGYRNPVNTVAEEQGIGRKQILKYRRLKKLITELRNSVDRLEITVEAGYQLSFLSPDYQKALIIFLLENGVPLTYLRINVCKLIHNISVYDIYLFRKKLNECLLNGFLNGKEINIKAHKISYALVVGNDDEAFSFEKKREIKNREILRRIFETT